MMKKLIKSILSWGVIGFVLGLLLAPEKGEDTRKKVQGAVDMGKEKIEELKKTIKTLDE